MINANSGSARRSFITQRRDDTFTARVMGAVRTSDLTVASASAIAAWLLVRTTLRAPVALAVALVCVAYFVALRARVTRATGSVSLALNAFVIALCVVRAGELAWDLSRPRALAAMAVTAMAASAAVVASRRASVGAALSALAIGVGIAAGEAKLGLSLVWCLWLVRAVAHGWRASEARAWAQWIRWASAAVATVWAWRGATIGPLALMVGATREAGGVWASDERESARSDAAVFAMVSVAMVAMRAWDGCPLVFL